MKTLSDLTRRVGAAIRRQRKRLGFSQEAFADHIGMHRAYYGALERGEKNMQLTTLERVARGLGVLEQDLIAEAEAMGRADAAAPTRAVE